MIILYNANDTTYDKGGINITKYCKSARVKEIINGSYNLEVTLVYNAMLWNSISNQMQIRVPTHRGKPMTFRIKDISKDLNTLKLTCRHIFWDLGNNLIEDIYIKTLKGKEAINYILENGQYPTKWKGDSDIAVEKNCRIVREHQLDALMGSDDNTFKSRWGGELTIDDYFVRIDRRRGSEEPVTISYKKDLIGFEFYEDTTDLATRVMPIGFDGLLLPELYVDSPLIDKYAMPYIRKYKMDDIKVATSDESSDVEGGFGSKSEAWEEMRRRVEEEIFGEQQADRPKQNIRANLKALRQSVQYAMYGFDKLEGIQLGDSVRVEIHEYNIETLKRCISIEYDALLERYIEVELGEFKGYDETDSSLTTSEINLDDKLSKYKSGMFFHSNDKIVSITSTKKQAAFLNFGSVEDTHLQFTMCMVGNATGSGVITAYIELDNTTLPFRPMQVVQEGYFTWTVAIPLLFITSGIAHSVAVSFESTNTISVAKEQLVFTIYGQAVEGGAGATYPHAEVIEEMPNSILSDYKTIKDEVCAITILSDFINNTFRDEFNNVLVDCSSPVKDEYSVTLTHKGFLSVWDWSNYETTSTRYTIDKYGISYNVDDVSYESTVVQQGEDFNVIELELPSTDTYYIIEEGEIK